MRMKRTISLTALMTFILLSITSVVLSVTPRGSVAFWTDWHFWGLTRNQWINIHITNGFLFLAVIVGHIYYNLKPIIHYMRNREKALIVATKEFNVALLLSFSLLMLTFHEVTPASWIIEANQYYKNKTSQQYRTLPYGYAKHSSITAFLIKTGYNPDKAMQRLKNAGIHVDSPAQTMSDIADKNKISPITLFLKMKPPDFSEKPELGFGKRFLVDICNNNDLNVHVVMNELLENNIIASFDMTIREIAEKNNLTSTDLYYILKRLSSGIY